MTNKKQHSNNDTDEKLFVDKMRKYSNEENNGKSRSKALKNITKVYSQLSGRKNCITDQ
jgi:hypothetical protein